jgi:hypothetical protein
VKQQSGVLSSSVQLHATIALQMKLLYVGTRDEGSPRRMRSASLPSRKHLQL